jgi:hypothetical protein
MRLRRRMRRRQSPHEEEEWEDGEGSYYVIDLNYWEDVKTVGHYERIVVLVIG